MKKIILKRQLKDGIIPKGQQRYFFVPFWQISKKKKCMRIYKVKNQILLLSKKKRFFSDFGYLCSSVLITNLHNLDSVQMPGASRTGGLRTTSISQASRVQPAPPAVRLMWPSNKKLTKKKKIPFRPFDIFVFISSVLITIVQL